VTFKLDTFAVSSDYVVYDRPTSALLAESFHVVNAATNAADNFTANNGVLYRNGAEVPFVSYYVGDGGIWFAEGNSVGFLLCNTKT
jgi:hypothetical protein